MDAKALDYALSYVDSWLRFRYGQEDLPGYAVAVSHEGRVLLDEAYGYADLGKQTALTPQHVFRIASQAKSFTAIALLQLQEDGRLRIDDHVIDHLPWLREHKDGRWQEVTIRQLMAHSAGVIRDGVKADYWSLEEPFPDEESFRAEMMDTELVIDVNTAFKYSNCGYALLGLVIESVSGQTYNEYVMRQIISPLRLASTGPEYEASIHDSLAAGHTRQEADKRRRVLPLDVDTRVMSPALGFYSTARDLCAYYTAQMTGSKKLLSDEAKKEMQRPQFSTVLSDQPDRGYGLGLRPITLCGRVMIDYGGGFPGCVTSSIADDEHRLVVAVLVNANDGPAQAIAESIHKIIDLHQKNPPTNIGGCRRRRRIEGRYASVFDIIDVTIAGDKVIVANPESWEPLTKCEELSFISESNGDATLRIKKADTFAAQGELVRFTLEGDEVKTVNYAGLTMYPEGVWNERQSGA